MVTLVHWLIVQQLPDLVGGLAARALDDGQVSLDPDFRVQLAVLQDVQCGFLELRKRDYENELMCHS